MTIALGSEAEVVTPLNDAAAPSTAQAVTRWQLTAWSLIAAASSMMMIPLNAIIPAFYAKNTAVSLAAVGEALLLARLYDAVVDPAVGYLSDRTRSPIGRRKPWIIAGGAIACVSSYLLFNPTAATGSAYFFIVILLFYTASSMLTVPHSAWGAELTRNYAERSLVSGALTFSGIVGMLLVMGLPIVLSAPMIGIFKTGEITPPMLSLIGWTLVALIPLCVWTAAVAAPQGQLVEHDKTETPRLRAVVRNIWRNRPFWMFLIAYALTGLGYGVYYATTYLFLDAYMGMAGSFALIYAISAVSQLVCIPIWTRIAQKVDRARLWALGIAAFGLATPVRLLIHQGPGALPMLLGVAVIGSFANAASQVPQMAVLADCIDYGRLKSGTQVAGSYYALQNFVLKAMLAVGGSAAFFALSIVGFDAKAPHHAPKGLERLAAIHTFAPLVLFVGSGALLWLYPLNARRVAIVRRRLDALSAHTAASAN